MRLKRASTRIFYLTAAFPGKRVSLFKSFIIKDQRIPGKNYDKFFQLVAVMKHLIVYGTRFHSFICKLVAVNNLAIATHKGINVDLFFRSASRRRSPDLANHILKDWNHHRIAGLEEFGMKKNYYRIKIFII